MLGGVLDRASKGDPDAVADLLSQPEISEDAEPYWAAFERLSPRERPYVGGMVAFPRPVPRDLIEREGRRLGYEHDDLDDFVRIIVDAEDFSIELEMKRLAEESSRRVGQMRRPGHS